MIHTFFENGWARTPERFAIAAAITLGFTLVARLLRGVSGSGALAGALVCLVLYSGAGPDAFALLVTLFVLTWLSTRIGHRKKLALKLAERRDGRNGWQVSANISAAAFGALLFSVSGNRIWLLALTAALAEAATDTVASEIGQFRHDGARLITTGERVPAGTDGGITIPGSIAGLVAGLLVCAVASVGGMVSLSQLWIPAIAGFVGMLIDSLLGATLQRLGWISNQTVNVCSSIAAAVLALSVSSFQ